jgi:hypothetical protein
MRKLILMSVMFVPLIVAMRASAAANPRRGLRRTVLVTLIFTVLWALITPWLVGALGE